VTFGLQGIEMRASWDHDNLFFPPLHLTLLGMHYFTSICKAIKGSVDNFELNNDEDDSEELSDPEKLA
jgi:hypothetical protein